MADISSDFAQVANDIKVTEDLIGRAKALTDTMKGDGGSFTNFQNDFNNLLGLLDEIDASLGTSTPVTAPSPAPAVATEGVSGGEEVVNEPAEPVDNEGAGNVGVEVSGPIA